MTLKRILTCAGMTAVVAGSLVFGAQAAYAAPAVLTAPIVTADPVEPEDTTPVDPVEPADPTDPADPADPTDPVDPGDPAPTDPATDPGSPDPVPSDPGTLPESGPSTPAESGAPGNALPPFTFSPPLASTGTYTPTPIDESELNAPGPVSFPLSSSTVTPGATVTITLGTSGTPYAVWLHSTPVYLGTQWTGAAGTITVTIPADAAPGQHKLVLQGADRTLVGWAAITIVRPGSVLAETGVPTGLPIGIGAVLLAAGAALVVARGSRAAARRS